MSTIDPTEQHQANIDYFEAYLELFTQPGWKMFIDDLAGGLDKDQKSAVSRCTTAESWHEERGAQAKTLRIMSFETMIRNSYDEYLESLKPTDLPEED